MNIITENSNTFQAEGIDFAEENNFEYDGPLADISQFLSRIDYYGLWLNIPDEMKKRPQWALASKDKIPLWFDFETGKMSPASSTDPATWADFKTVVRVAKERNLGIGYVLSKDDPFTCIDLDVKDDTPQECLDRHQAIIDYADSYTEVSRSGKGTHIWVKGKLDKGYRRDGVELYPHSRFIICTGNVIKNRPIEPRQDMLNNMTIRMSPTNVVTLVEVAPTEPDEVILDRAKNASNGVKFNTLWAGDHSGYPSQSEADEALLQMLCFYTESNGQVMKLFRQSGLGKRDKAKRDDYLNRSIKRFRSEQAAKDAVNLDTFKQKVENLFDRFQKNKTVSTTDGGSILDKIRKFSMNGHIAKMKDQMMNDVYVLDGLALLGQWTTFSAAPNSGKTLITLNLIAEAVENGRIDGEKVFYVNCDDSYKGKIIKGELAEKYGFHMLSDGTNGFNSDDVKKWMEELSKSEEAMGTVLILDTLKKFVDLMDKKVQSKFNKTARAYIAAGGTLIALSHVNKNKDNSGKSIRSGTSDQLDDCDCFYIIEREDSGDKILARFRNEKMRGNMVGEAVYSFAKTTDNYESLFYSVRREDNLSEPNIAIITDHLKQFSEPVRVSALKKWCTDKNRMSCRKFDQLLDNGDKTHWFVSRGDKNARMVSLRR